MKSPIFLAIGLLLLTGPGCGANPPPADPPPAGFAGYYAGELFLTEKTKLDGGDSTSLAARLDSLRLRHGLTVRQRDSLLAYCQASLPRWEAFLQEVLADLESRGNTGKGPGGIGGRSNGGNGPGPGEDRDTGAGPR